MHSDCQISSYNSDKRCSHWWQLYWIHFEYDLHGFEGVQHREAHVALESFSFAPIDAAKLSPGMFSNEAGIYCQEVSNKKQCKLTWRNSIKGHIAIIYLKNCKRLHLFSIPLENFQHRLNIWLKTFWMERNSTVWWRSWGRKKSSTENTNRNINISILVTFWNLSFKQEILL